MHLPVFSRLAPAALAVCALAIPQALAKDDAIDFAGVYAVQGQNPDGTSGYDGQANIIRTGETWRVEWYVGDQTFVGTGIGYGDVLAVGYDGGTAVYQRDTDGTLYGAWAVNGGDTLGAEVLTPILGE
ncbi:MAG: hypothetical protein R3F55_23905 [Alphaproteobacteria bacterium]